MGTHETWLLGEQLGYLKCQIGNSEVLESQHGILMGVGGMFGRTRTHLEFLSFPRLNLILNLDLSQLYLLLQDTISWVGDDNGVSGEVLWVTDIYKDTTIEWAGKLPGLEGGKDRSRV